MKKIINILLAALLFASVAFKANAQALDMLLLDPSINPAPAVFPGTSTISFKVMAEILDEQLSSDDFGISYATINIGLSNLQGSALIMPTGPGADLFNWQYNAVENTYIGTSKDATLPADLPLAITLTNLPIVAATTALITGFLANLTPPGDLLDSQSADDAATILTSAAAGPQTTSDVVVGTVPGGPVLVTVLTNDTPGSAAIDVTSVKLVDPVGGGETTSVTIPGQGTYTVDPATGVVTFTPIAGFSGQPTPVQYTIKDINGIESNISTITVDIPLPVTLVSFNVVKEGKVALLNWATTEETNSDHFEIQHSVSGKDWQNVGTVASNGESKTRKTYSFTHKTPVNGENLYRLKMIDKDQTFAYSRIQSVKFEGLSNVLVSAYPNPSTDRLFIKDADLSSIKLASIIDMSGRTVFNSSKVDSNGINVSSLSQGTYILHITSLNGTTSSHKIMIVR